MGPVGISWSSDAPDMSPACSCCSQELAEKPPTSCSCKPANEVPLGRASPVLQPVTPHPEHIHPAAPFNNPPALETNQGQMTNPPTKQSPKKLCGL